MAVDVMQAYATRCSGITGFLQVAALCEAFDIPLSSHCAPAAGALAPDLSQPGMGLELRRADAERFRV